MNPNFPRRAVLALAVAALFAPLSAQSQMTPFVDNYSTNKTANQTVANNAAINLLKGYSQLWNTGTAWNTGSPTAIGQAVMDASQAYVVQVTTNRTAAQAEAAYFNDRRHQSYSAIDGLGSMAGAFRTASGATTTITSMPAAALTGKFDDKGNGAGLTSSASVGKIVELVNTLRGNDTSSNPSKAYFNSPRPWRMSDSNAVIPTGTETTGYYTSTLANGSPNTGAAQTYFPDYQSNVVIVPELLAVRSTTPATDGGFVSGHTNAAYLASIALAYAVPGSFQSAIFNASQMGHNRIVAGMHSPLDVIGGRMLATALGGAILSPDTNKQHTPAYLTQLKNDALAQGKAFVAANSSPAGRFDELNAATVATNRANRDTYTFRMTYGLPTTGATNVAAVVPKGAEVLLESRQTYLDASQRREVLRTTAIASGNAVTDDEEGWGRLNLYAAADGYGRFDSNVTVNMNAANGGFDARDAWRNDISGTGGLTKQGSGELGLTGNNSFTGGVSIEGGSIVAASATALGLGNVTVGADGRLVNYSGDLQLGGNFTQQAGGMYEVILGNGLLGGMRVAGGSSLAGSLLVSFMDGYLPSIGSSLLIDATGGLSGQFDQVLFSGLASNLSANISYSANGVSLNVAAVPEPSTYLMLLAGLGLLGITVKRRRA